LWKRVKSAKRTINRLPIKVEENCLRISDEGTNLSYEVGSFLLPQDHEERVV
jgi:hypothetical protein